MFKAGLQIMLVPFAIVIAILLVAAGVGCLQLIADGISTMVG